MTGAKKGILMLTGRLGNANLDPLTARQFHALRRRLREEMQPHERQDAELQAEDIRRLGLSQELTDHILRLLCREDTLAAYLARGSKYDIFPVTRLDTHYPRKLEAVLGDTAPTALYCKGDASLLDTKCVSLVGSRRLDDNCRAFARQIGLLAAKEGLTLVSGGAAGADSEAQEACLQNGGNVIVFTPDKLTKYPLRKNVLYCSEEGFDEGFTAQRALARNRLIHAMGEKTFVAHCTPQKGGTWHGTQENLRSGYSPVFVFADGSKGALALAQSGAAEIGMPASLFDAEDGQRSLF